jgi:hypothetical protein
MVRRAAVEWHQPVVHHLPRNSTSSYEHLYAGMLLRVMLKSDPSIENDIHRYFEDHAFPDGTPFTEPAKT